jgi:hypothetical protein
MWVEICGLLDWNVVEIFERRNWHGGWESLDGGLAWLGLGKRRDQVIQKRFKSISMWGSGDLRTVLQEGYGGSWEEEGFRALRWKIYGQSGNLGIADRNGWGLGKRRVQTCRKEDIMWESQESYGERLGRGGFDDVKLQSTHLAMWVVGCGVGWLDWKENLGMRRQD